jgi:membrane protease YdiL (CAAX protease family)
MSLYLGQFVIAPLLIAMVIPLAYSLLRGRHEIRAVSIIILASAAAVLLYPAVNLLSAMVPVIGYSIGKLIIFVAIPLAAVLFLERSGLRKSFQEMGVRRPGLARSIIYGILVAFITVSVIVLGLVLGILPGQAFDPLFRTVMFLEAFTEEFFFRGFLLLYLISKTSRAVGFSTSILAFILAHPQHFIAYMLIPTILQGALLAWVAYRTRKIIGPWVSHGMNRFLPGIIAGFF